MNGASLMPWQTRKPATEARRRQIVAEAGGRCVCCGETTFEFLTIEHVNGNGNAERKQRAGDTGRLNATRMLIKAAKAGIDGRRYALLCANCNAARANWGRCPHERGGGGQ